MLHGAPSPRDRPPVRLRRQRRRGGRRRLAGGARPRDDDAARADVADLHDHRVRRVGAHVGGDRAGRPQRPEGHPPLGLRVGPGRLGDGRVVRARDARRRRGRAPGRRRVLVADGAGAARRRRARAVGRHRGRELPVRARLHDVDVAHDVRVRARRRAARIGRAQARVAALAHAGARDLDDRGAGARVDAVRARVFDADDRVRDLPVPVVRDADAGRAARLRPDLDPVRSVSSRRRRSTSRSPSCRCWARRCSSGSACSPRTRRR